MGGGTVADRDEMRIIEETLSLETALVIVTAPTAPTIIGGDGISHIGETLTRIGNIGATDVDTDIERFRSARCNGSRRVS
jgi:hypothetical protein